MVSMFNDYKVYILVWAALVVLTAATYGISYLDLGIYNAVAALVIASVKASLVALFFMHLKGEKRLVWAFALFPLGFLALIILGTLSDTYFR